MQILHPPVLVLLALLAGCQQPQIASKDGDVSPSQDFDRHFLDQMSNHHAGAIALAQLAEQKGARDHVRSMGKMIGTKQEAEVRQLKAWRTQWFGQGTQPVPDEKSQQALTELKGLRGEAFDKAFVTKMIAHHQDGIAMATPATKRAAHPEVRQFAQQMIDDQTKEIAHLREHLQEWSDNKTDPGE